MNKAQLLLPTTCVLVFYKTPNQKMEEPDNVLYADLDENGEILHIDAVGLNIEFGNNNSNDEQGGSCDFIIKAEAATEGKDR